MDGEEGEGLVEWMGRGWWSGWGRGGGWYSGMELTTLKSGTTR